MIFRDFIAEHELIEGPADLSPVPLSILQCFLKPKWIEKLIQYKDSGFLYEEPFSGVTFYWEQPAKNRPFRVVVRDGDTAQWGYIHIGWEKGKPFLGLVERTEAIDDNGDLFIFPTGPRRGKPPEYA
jgi:hypothetical protein